MKRRRRKDRYKVVAPPHHMWGYNLQETQFMKVRSKTPVPWRCMTLRLAEVIHKMQHDEPRPETLKGKRETEIETEMKREK